MTESSEAAVLSPLDMLRQRQAANEIARPSASPARLWRDLRLLGQGWLEEKFTAMLIRRLTRHSHDRRAMIEAIRGLPMNNQKWQAPTDERANNPSALQPIDGLTTDAYWMYRAPTNRGLMVFLPATSFIMPAGRKQVRALQSFATRYGVTSMMMHYPLAPEEPFPAAIERVAADYESLIQSHGYRAEEIVICAASAGASVGLGALQLVRQAGAPMPAGLLLFSPWVDLTMSGWSYVTRGLAAQIPIRMEFVAFCARLYLGEQLAISPLASPLFADLTGMPPMQVHASRRDIYFDDSVRLVQRAREAGIEARINYWDHPQHFLEQFLTPEAAQSLELAADFVKARLSLPD